MHVLVTSTFRGWQLEHAAKRGFQLAASPHQFQLTNFTSLISVSAPNSRLCLANFNSPSFTHQLQLTSFTRQLHLTCSPSPTFRRQLATFNSRFSPAIFNRLQVYFEKLVSSRYDPLGPDRVLLIDLAYIVTPSIWTSRTHQMDAPLSKEFPNSCDTCLRRKEHCDRKGPCYRCDLRIQECVYTSYKREVYWPRKAMNVLIELHKQGFSGQKLVRLFSLLSDMMGLTIDEESVQYQVDLLTGSGQGPAPASPPIERHQGSPADQYHCWESSVVDRESMDEPRRCAAQGDGQVARGGLSARNGEGESAGIREAECTPAPIDVSRSHFATSVSIPSSLPQGFPLPPWGATTTTPDMCYQVPEGGFPLQNAFWMPPESRAVLGPSSGGPLGYPHAFFATSAPVGYPPDEFLGLEEDTTMYLSNIPAFVSTANCFSFNETGFSPSQPLTPSHQAFGSTSTTPSIQPRVLEGRLGPQYAPFGMLPEARAVPGPSAPIAPASDGPLPGSEPLECVPESKAMTEVIGSFNETDFSPSVDPSAYLCDPDMFVQALEYAMAPATAPAIQDGSDTDENTQVLASVSEVSSTVPPTPMTAYLKGPLSATTPTSQPLTESHQESPPSQNHRQEFASNSMGVADENMVESERLAAQGDSQATRDITTRDKSAEKPQESHVQDDQCTYCPRPRASKSRCAAHWAESRIRERHGRWKKTKTPDTITCHVCKKTYPGFFFNEKKLKDMCFCCMCKVPESSMRVIARTAANLKYPLSWLTGSAMLAPEGNSSKGFLGLEQHTTMQAPNTPEHPLDDVQSTRAESPGPDIPPFDSTSNWNRRTGPATQAPAYSPEGSLQFAQARGHAMAPANQDDSDRVNNAQVFASVSEVSSTVPSTLMTAYLKGPLSATTPTSQALTESHPESHACQDPASASEISNSGSSTHAPARKHQCPKCGRLWAYESQLIAHLRRHSGEKPFPCLNCGTRFVVKEHLKRHLLRCDGRPRPPRTENRGSRQCPGCRKFFVRMASLTRHERDFADQKFVCRKCGKHFPHKEDSKHSAAYPDHKIISSEESKDPAQPETSSLPSELEVLYCEGLFYPKIVEQLSNSTGTAVTNTGCELNGPVRDGGVGTSVSEVTQAPAYSPQGSLQFAISSDPPEPMPLDSTNFSQEPFNRDLSQDGSQQDVPGPTVYATEFPDTESQAQSYLADRQEAPFSDDQHKTPASTSTLTRAKCKNLGCTDPAWKNYAHCIVHLIRQRVANMRFKTKNEPSRGPITCGKCGVNGAVEYFATRSALCFCCQQGVPSDARKVIDGPWNPERTKKRNTSGNPKRTKRRRTDWNPARTKRLIELYEKGLPSPEIKTQFLKTMGLVVGVRVIRSKLRRLHLAGEIS